MSTDFELMMKVLTLNDTALKAAAIEIIKLQQENKVLQEENERLRLLVLEWQV